MLHRLVALCVGLAALGCFATTGWAVDPAGTYAYKEKGYKGTMVIEHSGPGFLHLQDHQHRQRPGMRLPDLRNARGPERRPNG